MKKATIRDIAEAAGVSISSVHLALNGKSGVSQATREKVKRIAAELEYKPNILASNLKRDARSVAVVIPPPENDSRYYFDYMWNAIDAYEPIAADYNLQITRFVCGGVSRVLDNFDASRFSGIVSVGDGEYFRENDFLKISGAGVPLVLMDSDVKETQRLCCVQTSAEDVGNLTAELLLNMVHRLDGEILVCGMGPSAENRRMIEQAIARALGVRGLAGKLRILDFDRVDGECMRELGAALESGRFAGACAVNSRSTRILGEAIAAAGQQGFFPVIGSGFFAESKKQLLDGVFTAIVDKRPYAQCYRALQVMENLLVKDLMPPTDVINMKIDVIFRSTVEQHELHTQCE